MLNLGYSSLFSLFLTLSVFTVTMDLVGKIPTLSFSILIFACITLALFSLILLWELVFTKS